MFLVCAVGLAHADAPKTVTADAAKAVIRALKAAKVKPVGKQWKVAELFCKAVDTPDKVGAIECTADKQKLVDAAALVVQQAIVAAGVPEKYGMGGNRFNAYALECSLEGFTCSFATEPPAAK